MTPLKGTGGRRGKRGGEAGGSKLSERAGSKKLHLMSKGGVGTAEGRMPGEVNERVIAEGSYSWGSRAGMKARGALSEDLVHPSFHRRETDASGAKQLS